MSITDLWKEKILCYYPDIVCNWSRENMEGIQVSVRLLDEFGKMYLNKGKIGSKIVFDDDYYKLSVEKYSDGGFPERLPYGLGWWIGSHNKVSYFYAAGFGGQILGVIPERNMVISIVSAMDRAHPENRRILEKAIELYGSIC